MPTKKQSKNQSQPKNNQSEVSKPSTVGLSIAKLTWLPNKVFTLEFSVPWSKVKNVYQEVLKQVVDNTTLKGFRKGKAPQELVEKNIDKAKLYEEVIRKLLPETYDAAVKQHRLAPIINPKIEVVSLKENSDWQFKATSCERPIVKLGNYQQLIKGELAKTKIWTPGKGKPEDKSTSQSQEEKLSLVTQLLLKNISVDLALMLVEDETNRLLSRFLDQVNSLGMTIDQYLSSKTLTKEQLKHQYQHQAEDTLKIEFILQAIVEDKAIKVEASEIDNIIQGNKDEKVRQEFNAPMQKVYLAAVLAKRKAIDFLLTL